MAGKGKGVFTLMINDFLIVQYHKEPNAVDLYANSINRSMEPDRFETHKKLTSRIIYQIKSFYPRANIHVLTNETGTLPVVYHVMKDLPLNNLCKLFIYGILDRPCMFVDSDIMLVKPFEPKHVDTDNEFLLYSSYKPEGYSENYPHYNTGVVWINKPSCRIVDELLRINQTYDDPYKWHYNDEYPVSRYVFDKNMKMYQGNDVNVYRSLVCDLEHMKGFDRYQSIHYAVPKKLLLKELVGRLKLT